MYQCQTACRDLFSDCPGQLQIHWFSLEMTAPSLPNLKFKLLSFNFVHMCRCAQDVCTCMCVFFSHAWVCVWCVYMWAIVCACRPEDNLSVFAFYLVWDKLFLLLPVCVLVTLLSPLPSHHSSAAITTHTSMLSFWFGLGHPNMGAHTWIAKGLPAGRSAQSNP